ncbi:MAG: M48 family metallopeptidase [Thermoanaerobaculia bacterium]|nr:M48 family metallopeptidase [Thermoanaerobaculia bacterium]
MRHETKTREAIRLEASLTLLVVTIVTLFFLGGCATSGVNKGDINVVSLEEEWQLGAKLAADIEKQMTIVHDRQVNAVVSEIGQRIVSQTEMAELPWNFHVVQDSRINAFNIPGGHVYVTTGLIGATTDVAQFAGVMAHEVAHGVARHGTEQLTRTYGLSIIANLLLGENPAVYEQILAQVVGSGTLARYSRKAEREADLHGLHYMYDAGYDPDGMARMFEMLLESRERRPSRVERLFATHPLTEERLEFVRSEADQLPPRSGLVAHDREYQQVHQRYRG